MQQVQELLVDQATGTSFCPFLVVLLVISTSVHLFDVYLDCRQKSTYEIETPPDEFIQGFNLANDLDKKHKKGTINEPADGIYEPLIPDHEKIQKDFNRSQKYNLMHIKVTMTYKLVIIAFWIAFWLGSLQERVWEMNRNWMFPNQRGDQEQRMSMFWVDFWLALLFESQLIVVHQIFFASIAYYDFFVVKKQFGFLNTTSGAFLFRRLVTDPLFEMIRTAILTLICLSAYNWGLKINDYVFIAIAVIIITTVVVSDIIFSSKLTSCTRGKLHRLQDQRAELHERISKKWMQLSGKTTQLECYILKGESGHSNCYVDAQHVVIYDSMFEHMKDENHILVILAHEMGHTINRDVIKIIIMRVLYYNVIFIGFIFPLKYRQNWLPMFGVTHDSLFLAIFILMHFIHFKVVYYVYEVIENAVQRNSEFAADEFATENTVQNANLCIQALQIIFYHNKSDYYTDPMYSAVKNNHPTLQERIDNLQKLIRRN